MSVISRTGPPTSLQASTLFSLKGKTAVLTGASGYLGRTFARTLLTNGARVIVIGRSERLEQEAQAWTANFGRESVRCMRVDMYDRAALQRVLINLRETEGSVDVLVNNAHELGASTGFNTAEGTLEQSTADQWTKNFTGGVYWAVETTQILGEVMKKQGQGSIVNISTMYALVAPRPALYAETKFVNPPGYSASKAALLAFTRYTASYWGSFGIRANAILPGPFSNTEDMDSENGVAPESDFLNRLRSFTSLGRVGRAHELAGALLFLASNASSFMTGQSLVVDGGWTAV